MAYDIFDIQKILREYCNTVHDSCKNCPLYNTLRYDESCPIDQAIDKLEKINTILER